MIHCDLCIGTMPHVQGNYNVQVAPHKTGVKVKLSHLQKGKPSDELVSSRLWP